MKKINWEDKESDIKYMFTNGKPIKEIAQKYDCNPTTILYKLKEWGFDTSRKSWNFKKYEVDDTFFEKIDS